MSAGNRGRKNTPCFKPGREPRALWLLVGLCGCYRAPHSALDGCPPYRVAVGVCRGEGGSGFWPPRSADRTPTRRAFSRVIEKKVRSCPTRALCRVWYCEDPQFGTVRSVSLCRLPATNLSGAYRTPTRHRIRGAPMFFILKIPKGCSSSSGSVGGNPTGNLRIMNSEMWQVRQGCCGNRVRRDREGLASWPVLPQRRRHASESWPEVASSSAHIRYAMAR